MPSPFGPAGCGLFSPGPLFSQRPHPHGVGYGVVLFTGTHSFTHLVVFFYAVYDTSGYGLDLFTTARSSTHLVVFFFTVYDTSSFGFAFFSAAHSSSLPDEYFLELLSATHSPTYLTENFFEQFNDSDTSKVKSQTWLGSLDPALVTAQTQKGISL